MTLTQASDGPGEFSCRRSADGGIAQRAKKAKKDESAPPVEAHQDAIIGDELSPLVVGGEKFWSKRFKERRELARAFTYLLVPEQKRQITAALAAPIEAIPLPTALLFTFSFFFVPQSSSSHPWGPDASRSKKTPLKGQAIERSKSMTKKWPMLGSDGVSPYHDDKQQ